MYTTWGGSRIVRFETDQPAEDIRDFYRSEMPKHGWFFFCSSEEPEAKECQNEYSQAIIIDRYKRDDGPSLVQDVSIYSYRAGERAFDLENSNNRVVEVSQASYPVSGLAPPPTQESMEGEILYTPGVYPGPGAPSPVPLLRPVYP